jgi:hypothetical protein
MVGVYSIKLVCFLISTIYFYRLTFKTTIKPQPKKVLRYVRFIGRNVISLQFLVLGTKMVIILAIFISGSRINSYLGAYTWGIYNREFSHWYKF